MTTSFTKPAGDVSSDEVLVRMTIQGNQKAFESLVKRYETAVYNYLYRMLNNDAHRAEEAAQETFVHAYKNLGKFKENSTFRPWLFGIATNQAKNAWRYQTRRQTYEESSLNLDNTEHLDIPDPSPDHYDEQLMNEAILSKVNSAIEAMDDRYKSVLLLRFQEGLSYQHIADTLQVQLNTVRTWLRRGKASLQKTLELEA